MKKIALLLIVIASAITATAQFNIPIIDSVNSGNPGYRNAMFKHIAIEFPTVSPEAVWAQKEVQRLRRDEKYSFMMYSPSTGPEGREVILLEGENVISYDGIPFYNLTTGALLSKTSEKSKTFARRIEKGRSMYQQGNYQRGGNGDQSMQNGTARQRNPGETAAVIGTVVNGGLRIAERVMMLKYYGPYGLGNFGGIGGFGGSYGLLPPVQNAPVTGYFTGNGTGFVNTSGVQRIAF